MELMNASATGRAPISSDNLHHRSNLPLNTDDSEDSSSGLSTEEIHFGQHKNRFPDTAELKDLYHEISSHRQQQPTSVLHQLKQNLPSAKKAAFWLLAANLYGRALHSTTAGCARAIRFGDYVQVHTYDNAFRTEKSWIGPFPEVMQALDKSTDWHNIVHGLNSSGKHISVRPSGFDNHYSFTNRIGSNINIHIDPHFYDQINMQNTSTCTTHSNRMAFAHEGAHAEGFANNPIQTLALGAMLDPEYGNFEEYRTIKITNNIAKQLGEPQRLDYSGEYVEGKNATDRNEGMCKPYDASQKKPPFEIKTSTPSEKFDLYQLFMTKNFPFVNVPVLYKVYTLINQHDTFASELASRLRKDGLTDQEKEAIRAEWAEHRADILAYTEKTFRGVMTDSPFSDCFIPLSVKDKKNASA